MTSAERDKLATMAGGEWKGSPAHYQTLVFPNCLQFSYKNPWHPELVLDDCRPLFAEIKQRGLAHQFIDNLWDIAGLENLIHPKDHRPCGGRCGVESWVLVWIGLTKVQPADIVAAFIKTIEEADEDGTNQQTETPAG